MAENAIKAFAASNLLVETNLRRLQEEYELDLGKRLPSPRPFKDIRLRFDLDIRRDSEVMSRYYAIFYCIERQTRDIVRDRMSDNHGVDWWNTTAVSQQIRDEVAGRIKKEVEAGIALRSTEPIDYTTFGELAQIIEKNWDAFSDTFENRRATKNALSQLNLLRSPIAHNSTFAESEAQRFNLAIEDWLRQQKLDT